MAYKLLLEVLPKDIVQYGVAPYLGPSPREIAINHIMTIRELQHVIHPAWSSPKYKDYKRSYRSIVHGRKYRKKLLQLRRERS